MNTITNSQLIAGAGCAVATALGEGVRHLRGRVWALVVSLLTWAQSPQNQSPKWSPGLGFSSLRIAYTYSFYITSPKTVLSGHLTKTGCKLPVSPLSINHIDHHFLGIWSQSNITCHAPPCLGQNSGLAEALAKALRPSPGPQVWTLTAHICSRRVFRPQ